MKILARDEIQRTLVVFMSETEWESLQRGAGIPGDKRSFRPQTETSILLITQGLQALAEAKSFRKELGALQTRWDKLATALDNTLDK